VVAIRLSVSKSSNATSLYVIKSTYINGKHSSRVVEKLGTLAELTMKLPGQDPMEWAKRRVEELNRQEKEREHVIMVPFDASEIIKRGEQHEFNGGYLFLQKIYHQLKLNEICSQITERHKFEFDLNNILTRLIYSRIIFPASKLSTYRLSHKFIEQPMFSIQHIYRSLEVIAKEMDFIQAAVYKNSSLLQKRRTSVLYYDCTNFFFEIEQEDGLKQYGYSKEHRPNPIVQMGLFMDGDGIPLSFCINAGNTNEQITMTPLEEKIIQDYGLSRFIVCTDSGLASTANRKFNNVGARAYITTQSVKKLKKHIKQWALADAGWKLHGSRETYNITELDNEKDKDKTYYKDRWINEDGLEQRIIVTFSIKYRDYHRQIRNSQVERAKKLVSAGPNKINKKGQNDYRRFIVKRSVAPEGVAVKDVFCIDDSLIEQEGMFDGFYAVCTVLQDRVEEIIAVNNKRWEIEECFRIMKTDFKARPVYLSRDDRIKAHFTTCFLALLIYRLLERTLDNSFTSCQIIDGLRTMNFMEVKGEGFIPLYTRSDFTDALHNEFGFRTDSEIVTKNQIKKIFRHTYE
jgi:transposase